MSLTRRAFLWSAAASAVAGRARLLGQGAPVFAHGVTSGDPLSDRVILWTRVTPPRASDRVRVRWEVTTDEDAPVIVRRGTVTTSAARDFTVKVDAGGLEPGRAYRYRFDALGEGSPTGRTATLPLDASRLRLAIVSCSNYPAGFFNVYAAIARRDDIDLVLHLGDYIYEFADGVFGDGTALGRVPDPEHEAVSLEDYRRRYATYRRDEDLQALHARVPCIAVWDDHELADNAWLGGPAGWADRRAAAMRAYFEWMPVRELPDRGDRRLYRSFPLGGLATLAMLDARSLRDGQVNADNLAGLANPRRTVLGARQEEWLADTLRDGQRSGATWSLIGQQVMFSPFTPPGMPVRNPDAWDGYQVERARIRALLGATGNCAVLTGDVHSSWAFDVPLDPWSGYTPHTGEGSVAVEFITPAVSSTPYFTGDQAQTLGPTIRAALPHLKYLEGEHRGFLLLEITRSRLAASWYQVPGVLERSPDARPAATLVVEAGAGRLTSS